MADFRRLYQKDLLDHSPVTHSDQVEFGEWSKRFAQWLYSANHISIRYRIEYYGVDIWKLSLGRRGIVLLLLYLPLDDSDNRPLVIDQPEENLDPQSVFEELVHLFVDAKANRQVIRSHTMLTSSSIPKPIRSSLRSPVHIRTGHCRQLRIRPAVVTTRGERLHACHQRATKTTSHCAHTAVERCPDPDRTRERTPRSACAAQQRHCSPDW